jgi:hypothetical protein
LIAHIEEEGNWIKQTVMIKSLLEPASYQSSWAIVFMGTGV